MVSREDKAYSIRAMTKIIVLHLFRIALTILVTTSCVYFLLRFVPGNPSLVRRGIVGGAQTNEHIETSAASPLKAYPRWLLNTMRLQFGNSAFLNQKALHVVAAQIGKTAAVAAISFLCTMLLALALVQISIIRNSPFLNRVIHHTTQVVIAIPEFWLALLLLFSFAIAVPLFPLFGSGTIWHYILPIATLVMSRAVVVAQLLSISARREREELYVVSAYLRGIRAHTVLHRYIFRNSIATIIPLLTIQFGYLFGGAVIVEQVFGIPGFGKVLLQSLQMRDYSVAEVSVFIIALIFSVLGLCADLLQYALNPRIRSHARERRGRAQYT